MEKPTKQSEVGLDVLVLLACPFCGGEAKTTLAEQTGCWLIGCNNSKCKMQPMEYFNTKEKAVKAWNKRA